MIEKIGWGGEDLNLRPLGPKPVLWQVEASFPNTQELGGELRFCCFAVVIYRKGREGRKGGKEIYH